MSRFRAVDGFSPIKRAEYSVDAGEWKYVEPVGQLSDAKTENYDFKVTPEPAKDGSASSEHVVVVRVYDRYDNMGAAKTLMPAKIRLGTRTRSARHPEQRLCFAAREAQPQSKDLTPADITTCPANHLPSAFLLPCG